MNIAIIIAGGSGVRMGQDIPKQFLNVYDKPVIVYTLEAFQQHPQIDAIEVVCIDGWHDVLKAYCKQFGISKFENVVAGGANGQESIHNGVADLLSRHSGDDIADSRCHTPDGHGRNYHQLHSCLPTMRKRHYGDSLCRSNALDRRRQIGRRPDCTHFAQAHSDTAGLLFKGFGRCPCRSAKARNYQFHCVVYVVC